MRVDRIERLQKVLLSERLQKALLSGNIASLLRADMSEASVKGRMAKTATPPAALSSAQASPLPT